MSKRTLIAVVMSMLATSMACGKSKISEGDSNGHGAGGEPARDATTDPDSARATDGSGETERGVASVEPATGALLGAYVSDDLAEFEGAIGRRVAILHKFWAWKDNFIPFVDEQVRAQRLAQVTWEAWQGGEGTQLDEIVGGAFDDMLQTRARGAKQIGKPFFLRWGHEMNGNWYPWDGSHNGGADGAQKYIAAFRHLHDVFVAEGATNVIWVFCPNVDSVPNEAWNDWTQYYPGDDYVDWLCFDGYNWGTTQSWGSTWQDFPTIVSRIYASLAAKGKPILIGEMASTEVGGDKATWIAGVLPALRTDFPRIKGLSWFNTNKETDWRAESSETALAAFRTMATDAWFQP